MSTIRFPQGPMLDDAGNPNLEWFLWFQNPEFASVVIIPGLPVTSGGTGLTSGTSGGILGFTDTTTLASSALLTNHALVIGGGAGATPSTPVGLGTTTTVLHGNATGNPSYGAVNLVGDITGVLREGNGGTHQSTYTQGDILYASAANTLAKLPKGTSGQILTMNSTVPTWATDTGTGTVTSVSVTTANGVSGTVATATTTPAISLTLGAITPTSVAASGTVTGSNLSGTNTGNQTITLTGDVTGSGTGSFAATLASVITAGGPIGSSSVVPVITYDAKGRLTTVTTATITPAAIGAPSGSGTSSGSNTGDQTITLTGDVTGSGTGSFAATLATVASADTNTKVTYNAKGLVTSGTSAVLASSDYANQGTTTTVLHGNAAGNPSFGAVSLTADVSGILPIANGGTGASTLKLPNYLFTHFADQGNGTTVETDLYSDTIAAGQLTTNGDKLEVEYGGVFVSSGTATRELKIYFAGTQIFDTGLLTVSLAAAWTAYTTITRVSASIIRYMISLTTEGAALAAYTAVGEVSGLTLSNTAVLKITGQAAGVGAATNDIVAKLGSIIYRPF